MIMFELCLFLDHCIALQLYTGQHGDLIKPPTCRGCKSTLLDFNTSQLRSAWLDDRFKYMVELNSCLYEPLSGK